MLLFPANLLKIRRLVPITLRLIGGPDRVSMLAASMHQQDPQGSVVSASFLTPVGLRNSKFLLLLLLLFLHMCFAFAKYFALCAFSRCLMI